MDLLLVGLGLGFFLAAQMGPVTLLIVRSVLRGGRAVAVGLAMAAAVASVDVLYAGLGLAGAGRLLEAGVARLALGLASTTILLAIGVRTLWRGLRARSAAETDEEVATPGQGFATALAATAVNPLTVALWTISFPASVAAAAGNSTGHAIAVLPGVAVGTLAWYGGFAAVVALARRRIGAHLLAAIDVVIGSALMAFAAMLGYRTLSEQTRP
jgi:putative LysE/RhtB family amino acid efflux pump